MNCALPVVFNLSGFDFGHFFDSTFVRFDLFFKTASHHQHHQVVERPRDVETTALGAALCAGIGAGVWTPETVADESAAAKRTGVSVVERVFEPAMSSAVREKLCGRWDRAVQSSLGWAIDEA